MQRERGMLLIDKPLKYNIVIIRKLALKEIREGDHDPHILIQQLRENGIILK